MTYLYSNVKQNKNRTDLPTTEKKEPTKIINVEIGGDNFDF